MRKMLLIVMVFLLPLFALCQDSKWHLTRWEGTEISYYTITYHNFKYGTQILLINEDNYIRNNGYMVLRKLNEIVLSDYGQYTLQMKVTILEPRFPGRLYTKYRIEYVRVRPRTTKI